jgi:hypothetical protein
MRRSPITISLAGNPIGKAQMTEGTMLVVPTAA